MKRTRALPASRDGYTLIEIIIAILLLSLLTVPIMSVALTGRMSVGRADRRMAAASAVSRLSERLKAYVTADASLVSGPGAGFSGWTLPGDSSGLTALQAGHHTLDVAQWAPALSAYGGTMSYDVAVVSSPSGPMPTVTFNINWNEP